MMTVKGFEFTIEDDVNNSHQPDCDLASVRSILPCAPSFAKKRQATCDGNQKMKITQEDRVQQRLRNVGQLPVISFLIASATFTVPPSLSILPTRPTSGYIETRALGFSSNS